MFPGSGVATRETKLSIGICRSEYKVWRYDCVDEQFGEEHRG